MSVESNLSLVKQRKAALLAGDAQGIASQKEKGKLTARERIALLVDEGSFVELDVLAGKEGKSGVITGYGLVDGQNIYLYAQDYTAGLGAMGAMQARKIQKVMALAQKTGAPILSILDSGGARLTEGVEVTAAYGALMANAAALSGVVPQITLIAGPCTGAMAVLASLTDLVLMANTGFVFANGPQIVAAEKGQDVNPARLGGAEAAAGAGTAHICYEDEQKMLKGAREIVGMLPANNLEDAPIEMTEDSAQRTAEALNTYDATWDALDVLKFIADDSKYTVLSKTYAPEVATAFARLDGRTVGFVGTQPSMGEGRLTASGAGKAARFVRLCDCFNIPVVTLVDSVGLEVVGGDKQGALLRGCGQLAYAYSEATTPKITLVMGQAIGAAQTILAPKATADLVYAWPGSVIAPLTAAQAVQVFEHEEISAAENGPQARAEREEAYARDAADGLSAAQAGYVDDVIEPAATRAALCEALTVLSGKRDSRPPKKHGNMPL